MKNSFGQFSKRFQHYRHTLLFCTFLLMGTTALRAQWNPQVSGTGYTLWGVSFVDASNGWAVGDFGTIVHTTDGGANWNTQVSGTGSTLLGVSFVDASNGWAVGTVGTIVHFSLVTVPTLGQWGLIILSLLILSFGVVALKNRESVLAGPGSLSSPTNLGQWPFDKAAFSKMMVYVMIGLAALFAVAIAAFGYQLTTADLPGSLIAGPVLAYLLHLAFAKENDL